jgi:hypothetical protein
MAMSDELLQRNETASLMTEDQLLRNAFDKVGVDGVGAQGSMHHDALAAAVNTALLSATPIRSRVISNATTARNLMIRGDAGACIHVFDIFLSVAGVTVISFVDADGNTIFPSMRCANTGQGFTFNSLRGFPIQRGKSVYIQSSIGVAYECAMSFAIV